MKNFFSVELGDSDDYSYPEYRRKQIKREVDETIFARQEAARKKLVEFQEKSTLTRRLALLRTALGVIGFILMAFALSAGSEDGLGGTVLAILALGGFIGLTAYAWKRRISVERSQEFKEFILETESLNKSVIACLNIPEDKVTIDVFCYLYSEKNGAQKNPFPYKYYNQPLDLFVEDGQLCIADAMAVFAFDVSDFTRILINPRRVSFLNWCKKERYNKGVYKDYKITTDGRGILYIKNSGSVQFVADGVEYEITIPPYELSHFERMLGIKAEIMTERDDEDEDETAHETELSSEECVTGAESTEE